MIQHKEENKKLVQQSAFRKEVNKVNLEKRIIECTWKRG